MICFVKRGWYAVLACLIAGIGFFIYEDEAEIVAVDAPVSSVEVQETVAVDRYEALRTERDNSRSMMRERLEMLIEKETDEAVCQAKKKELWQRETYQQVETEIEMLMKARGYSDAIAFCQPDSLCLVIRTQELDREEVIEIAPILARVSGVAEQHILIRAQP